MIEEKNVNNKANKNELYKQTPKENYIKIKIKRKNIDKNQNNHNNQNNQLEQSRNAKKINKTKNKCEYSENFPSVKLNLLLSEKKKNNTIKIIDNNLYKSATNINNSNDKSMNNGCSTSKEKKQKFYSNQRETPFLRKYILKLHRDESIHKEGNKDNQFYLKNFFSNNNSIYKDSNKEYYDYEYDHTIKHSHLETEVKETNNKNEFFNGESIESDRRRINQNKNKNKNNKNNLKEKINNKRDNNNKLDKNKKNIKYRNDNNPKEFINTISHVKNMSDLQNNFFLSNGTETISQSNKKKYLRINLSPIGSPNYENKIEGYFSDNEFYKPNVNLTTNNNKSNNTPFDNKELSQNLINDIFKRSYINSNSNIVCLICNKIAKRPLMCPKCEKVSCEECIKNKKTKNKFCSFCNSYISGIYSYIPINLYSRESENSLSKRGSINFKRMSHTINNKKTNNNNKNLKIDTDQITSKIDYRKKSNSISKTEFNTNSKINKNTMKINDNFNLNNILKNKTFKDKPKNAQLGSSITNIISKIKNIKNEKIGNSSVNNNYKNPKQTQVILNKIKNINNVNNNMCSRNTNLEEKITNQDENNRNAPLFSINEMGSLGSIKSLFSNTENDMNEYKEVMKEFNKTPNSKKDNIKNKIYGNKINENKSNKKEEYQNKLKIYINNIEKDKDKDDFFLEKIKEEDNLKYNESEIPEEFCIKHYKEKIIFFCLDCNAKYCQDCLKEITHNTKHQTINYPNECNQEFQKLINEYILNNKNKIINNKDLYYYEQAINLYEKEKNIFLEQLEIIKNNYINKINLKIQDIKNIIDKLKQKEKYLNINDSLLKKYFDSYKEDKKENILNEINGNNNNINDPNLENEKKIIEFSTINSLFQCISSQYITSNLINIKEKRSNALYTEIKFDKCDLNKFLNNMQRNNYSFDNKYTNINNINNNVENIEDIISEKELYFDENLLSLTEASVYIKNINDNALIQLNINLYKNEDEYGNKIDCNYICGFFLICQEKNNTFTLSQKKVTNGILTLYKVIPWNFLSIYDNVKYKIILYNNN